MRSGPYHRWRAPDGGTAYGPYGQMASKRDKVKGYAIGICLLCKLERRYFGTMGTPWYFVDLGVRVQSRPQGHYWILIGGIWTTFMPRCSGP